MRAVLIKQGDGTIAQWSNCVAAGFSMVVYGATNGAHPVFYASTHYSPFVHTIRVYYGVNYGGIPWSSAAACVKSFFNLTINPQYGLTWDQFRDFVIGGHPVDASINYSAVHGTAYDACHSFTSGLHSVAVLGRRWNSNLGREEFLVGDPLADGRYSWIPTGPQWWPAALLKKAMQASTGNTLVRAAIGPVPPPITVKKTAACSGGAIRLAPNLSGTKKAILTSGQVCTVSATVTGGSWAASMCGTYKSGSTWYRITAINGKSVSSLYGVAAVYAATGWFK